VSRPTVRLARVILAVAGLAVSSASPLASADPWVLAERPTYDYVALGYARLDPDPAGRLAGFLLEGSVALLPSFHLRADLVRSLESPAVRRLRVTVGVNRAWHERLDVVARLGGSFSRIEDGMGRRDSIVGQAGFRAQVLPTVELQAFITHDDALSTTSLDGVALLQLSPALSGLLGYSHDSEVETWQLGLRYHF